MQITIRHAEPADAAALQDLYAMPNAQAGTLQLPFPTLGLWQQRLEQSGVVALVAEVEGLLVGQLSLLVEPNPRRKHVAGIGMGVRDDWAGKGVGSALIAAALDLADNWLNLHRIELTVYTDNEAAQALYRKFGFTQEGLARDYAFRQGRYVDVFHMARVAGAPVANGMVDYQARLRPVIRALEQNPELCLSEAAKLASLSSYHFHRVFTAVTGETPAEMQRRLRLERAARSLCYSRDPVTEIAFSAGFASSQAFAKAFRKQFAMTPGTLRQQPSLLQLSKNGHAAAREAGYAESRSHERRQPMKTEQMAPRTLAYIRVTGPYGTGYEPVCDQLYQWSAEQGLAEGEWIFIYHDNPEITAPQQCRTDICVTVPAGTKGSGNVEIQQLVGGRYGQSRFTVTDPAQYPAFWQQHIGEVVAAGFEFDDRPCFELYHSFDPVTKVADVSFCSSLKG